MNVAKIRRKGIFLLDSAIDQDQTREFSVRNYDIPSPISFQDQKILKQAHFESSTKIDNE